MITDKGDRLKYGMSIDEIAIILGVSRQAVSQSLPSAFKKLKQVTEAEL